MVVDGKQECTSEDKKQQKSEEAEQDKSDKRNKTNAGQDDKRNPIDRQRTSTSAAATSDTTTTSNVQQQRPRRPRPLRPGGGAPVLRRQPGMVSVDPALVGMPIEAQIELASGVLQPAGRATVMPPRRPNYLPPVHHAGGRGFQAVTSLGATALTGANANKPNRYSWAQMQQWHAAQSAAAAAAEAAAAHAAQDHTGAGVAGGGERQSRFHYHFPTAFSRGAASRVLYVPNPIVNLSEHTKSRLVKIIEALKRFSEKWFSHVLLLLFLASYACLGAYIFISFEAPTEQWEKQLIIDTRMRIVNESYEMARESDSRDTYVDQFRAKFEEYERLLNRVCASGMTSSSLENQWTFWGALFYSMTVFTTIGYGHLTPITFAGRVATMIYAIFGIPILLMVLADLGKLLTRIIKYAFKKFRYLYNKLLGRKASVRTRKLIQDNTNQYIGVARHAFERGFATYIQPYQSRLPTRFRESARSGQHELIDSDQQRHHPNPDRMESSDVLITPAKQTKPVSPKIVSGKDSTSSPLAGVAIQTGGGPNIDGQQQTYEPSPATATQNTAAKGRHGQRSQSPAGSTSRARKISTHQKQAEQKKAHSSSSKHSFVAHSHSSSSCISAGKTGPVQAPKRASIEQAASVQTSEPSPPPSTDRKRQVSPEGSVALEMSDLKGQHSNHTAGELDTSIGQPMDLGLDEQQMNGGQEFVCEEEDEEQEDEDDLDIPVSFALFLLITYMMFGAVVFSIWESWNFFDSLYFVFISMSTIGFGDLVPQHPKRMIGTFAYLLFGLALTSMCINVVQEKIHATFLRAKMQIGEKMGFDLDQIMADDYYGGESGFDEAEELGAVDETASCGANSSVALSHTNSTGGGAVDTAAGQMALASPSSQSKATVATGGGELGAETGVGGGGGGALPTAWLGLKSKSKESLKLKKRTSGGAGSQEQPASGSVKRKTSSGNKRPAASAAAANQRQQQVAAAQQQQQQQPPPSPLKPHIETIRVLNLPVMTQVDDTPASPKRPANKAPEIELTGVRAFCEPLTRAFQTSDVGGPPGQSGSSASLVAQRPRLQASRSQPNSPLAKSLDVTPPRAARAPYQMNGSQANTFRQHQQQQQLDGAHMPRSYHYSTRSRASPSRGGAREAQQVAAVSSSGRERFYGGGVSRSLGGSRRASVSHELSQLDDLIVALSHSSRPDRFGPLLGIPSTAAHSRRPSSSASGQTATQAQSPDQVAARTKPPPLSTASSASSAAGFFHCNARRGTSLMVRPDTAQPPATTSDLRQKRSLVAGSQDTPPFLTPSGSSSQLAEHQRRKSSSSSVNSRMASARQSQRELNLSESQAALDELEAVKLSVRAAP